MNESSALPRLDGVRVLVLFGGHELFGQERAIIEVFRCLKELGLSARFMISSRWGDEYVRPELEKHGFETTRAPFGFLWGRYLLGRQFYYLFVNFWGAIVTNWLLWREARGGQVTHIFGASWLAYSYTFAGIALAKLPFVFRAGDELPIQTPLHKYISAHLVSRADGIVCISQFILRQITRLSESPGKLRVIYNYPPARVRAKRCPLPESPPGSIVCCYLGQISEHKGVAVLIEAAIQLIKRKANVVLWLAGGSAHGMEFFETQRHRVETAGLADRIVFLGYVENPMEMLARGDVHVCPSLFEEPLSNVVGEAKLLGKPSVVFPVGGLPELVEHKVDGYVCDDCSVNSLVQGLDYFVEHPQACKTAGEAARKSLSSKFGFDRFQRAWAEVFLETQMARNVGDAHCIQ